MAVRGGDFTAAVVARCVAEVPFYGELPRRTLDGEVARSITAVHDLLLRALREDGVMGPGDLTRLIEWSGRRAEERVPLEAVIAAYLIGAEVWWQVLSETAEPGNCPAREPSCWPACTRRCPRSCSPTAMPRRTSTARTSGYAGRC